MNTDALAGIAEPARAPVSNNIDTLMNAEALGFGLCPKRPAGLPFGTKPVRASVFISVLMLFYADTLAGIAKPARASVFNSL